MIVRPESSSSTRTSSGCSTSQETMYSRVSRDPMAGRSGRLSGAGRRTRRLALDDAGDLHQPRDGLARLGALADPLLGARAVDLDEGWLPPGVVAADALDEPPVAGRARICHDHPVGRLALLADSSEPDLDHRCRV